jgi:hypothetical protein
MTEWHVPEGALRAWADGGGGMAAAASVEAHLMTCARCRDALAGLAAPALLTVDPDDGWLGIRDRIEPQPLPLGGRVLTRLGVRETDATLLSSAPALTAAWLTGMVMVLLFAMLASTWEAGRGVGIFLLLAPLLPVAGVAAAYGAEADPTHELTLAAPYSKLRLLLLRTAAVVATCVPLTMVVGVPVSGPWWIAVVWLLPALAFVLVTLAAATFVPPVYAAGAITLSWTAATLPALIRREPLDLVDATSLVTYAAIALIAGIVFATRIKHLATDWRIG